MFGVWSGNSTMIRKSIIILLTMASTTSCAVGLLAKLGQKDWVIYPFGPDSFTDMQHGDWDVGFGVRMLRNISLKHRFCYRRDHPLDKSKRTFSSIPLFFVGRYYKLILPTKGYLNVPNTPPGNYVVSRSLDLHWYAMLAFGVLCGLYPSFVFVRGPLRRWWRRRKGLCIKCGYNLTGNESGVCPECGTEIKT